MSTISEREQREIEAANASGNTPVVLIHGLWVLPSSWANWVEFFTLAGYAVLTPDWPDDPATVAEARANPRVLAKKTLKQVADHTTEIIKALHKKPVVMGHSTGGLVAQMLAGPGAFKSHGCDRSWSFPGRSSASAARTALVRTVLDQPAHASARHYAVVQAVQVRLGERVGRGRGENALRHVSRCGVRDLSLTDGKCKPQPVDASEGQNKEPRARGPLLIIEGEKDHTVPPAMARAAYKRERRNPGVTKFVTIPNRGHALTVDHGWREVAQAALDFVKPYAEAAAAKPQDVGVDVNA